MTYEFVMELCWLSSAVGRRSPGLFYEEGYVHEYVGYHLKGG
jgi:hypothetical protein